MVCMISHPSPSHKASQSPPTSLPRLPDLSQLIMLPRLILLFKLLLLLLLLLLHLPPAPPSPALFRFISTNSIKLSKLRSPA